MKTFKNKILGVLGALGLLCGGVALAQVTLPYITSIAATDAVQIIKGGSPSAGNVYASWLQMQSSIFTSGSQHTATAPALTSCGTGSPAISGTDWAGTVTTGTTATGCVVTFNTAYTGVPYCVVSSQVAPGTSTPAYSVTATAITWVQASQSGAKFDYICIGRQGG